VKRDAQSESLEPLRAAMDEMDGRLLELLCERGRLVQRIQRVRDSKARVPQREAEILARLFRLNTGPYSDETVRRVWQALFEGAPEL